MKKALITLTIIISIYMFIGVKAEEIIEIPNDAIRIRVLANSNEEYDQNIKTKVKEEVQVYMYDLLKDVKTTEEAKQVIEKNMKNLNKKIGNYLHQLNYNESFDINFGLNYFPEKEYKGIKYKEGLYESLLIKLGEGKGNNWWCVLFPPLCLLEAEESDEIEYKSLVKEIIEKYF
ncbi:MAG: stage II sporulation protein R [Bacilli bacterium]|nr:stage II sporulation protein R [Bacilli bacterium]